MEEDTESNDLVNESDMMSNIQQSSLEMSRNLENFNNISQSEEDFDTRCQNEEENKLLEIPNIDQRLNKINDSNMDEKNTCRIEAVPETSKVDPAFINDDNGKRFASGSPVETISANQEMMTFTAKSKLSENESCVETGLSAVPLHKDNCETLTKSTDSHINTLVSSSDSNPNRNSTDKMESQNMTSVLQYSDKTDAAPEGYFVNSGSDIMSEYDDATYMIECSLEDTEDEGKCSMNGTLESAESGKSKKITEIEETEQHEELMKKTSVASESVDQLSQELQSKTKDKLDSPNQTLTDADRKVEDELLHSYFPSTDSESDSDRLVLDYKTQDGSDLEVEKCTNKSKDKSMSKPGDQGDGKQDSIISMAKEVLERVVAEISHTYEVGKCKTGQECGELCEDKTGEDGDELFEDKTDEDGDELFEDKTDEDGDEDAIKEPESNVMDGTKLSESLCEGSDADKDPNHACESDMAVKIGPAISLSGIHITAEEFSQIGSGTDASFPYKTCDENDDIDPSEIQSVPVCKPDSSTMKGILGHGQQHVTTPSSQNPVAIKIKNEKIDDGYDAALNVKMEPASNTRTEPVSRTETSTDKDSESASRYTVKSFVNYSSTPSSISIIGRSQNKSPSSMLHGIRQSSNESQGSVGRRPSNEYPTSFHCVPNGLEITPQSAEKGYVYTVAIKQNNIPAKPVNSRTPSRNYHPAVRTIAPRHPSAGMNNQTFRIVNGTTITNQAAKPVVAPAVKINTKSFNVSSITQMMQRKHKIGNYKAPIIPPHFRKYLLSYSPASCLECGDSFTTKDTLEMHQNRVSIQINYQCPLCKVSCIFYNKCAFLGHIRLHNKEQALAKNPAIQVKADILTINLAPKNQILKTLDREFKPIETLSVPDKQITCSECKLEFDETTIADHFGASEFVCSFNFVCYTCNMVLPKKCAFEAHKRYHSMKSPYTCPECGLVFEVFDNFRHHMTKECLHFSRTNVLRCEVLKGKKPCTHTEIRLTPFTKHLQTQHIRVKTTYVKVICSNEELVIKNEQTLGMHIASPNASLKTISKSYNCDFCPFTFTGLAGGEKAQDHMLTHLKEVKRNATFSYICTFCSQQSKSIFINKESLKIHMDKYHAAESKEQGQGSFRCCACQIQVESYPKLLSHQLRVHEHINSEFYFCNTCKVMFENPGLMQKHSCGTINFPTVPKILTLNQMTQKVEENIKKYNNPPKILLKIRSAGNRPLVPKPLKTTKHEPVEPVVLECQICRIEFKNNEEYINHNQTEHSSFPCHLCGLMYNSRNCLNQHIQSTHEGEKPAYFCFLCKKKGISRLFSQAALLEKHVINKHRISKSRANRFVAIGKETSKTRDKAKRKFVTDTEKETQPVKRLRTECSGVYTCVKCSYSSEDSQSFAGHIESHKTVEGIQCPECGLCFSVLPSLKKHLFMVHRIRNAEEYIGSKGIEEPEEMAPDSDDEFEDDVDVTTPRKTPFTDIAPVETVRKKDGPVGDLECRVCYREFDNISLLKNHMRSHGMAFIRSRRVSPNVDSKS